MLRSDVQRYHERRTLPCDTGNVYNTLRVACAGFACLGCRRWIQPAAYGELGSADRMGEINVKAGVVAYSVGAMRVVFRFGRTRRVPEVAPVRFEDAGTGAHLVLLARDLREVVDAAVDIRCPRLRIPSQRLRTCW